MTTPDQLNAIVGAAIQAMAEAGVSAQHLGAFAASYRIQVEKILGNATTLGEPDLLGLVKTAVREVMADSVPDPRKAETGRSAEAVRRIYVRIGERRTSVSIPADVYAAVVAREAGSTRKAARWIESVAQQAPEDVDNRSAWIVEQMRAMHALGEIPTESLGVPH